MDILYRCCAGLDVHKQTVVACVRRIDAAGAVHQEVRTFGTMTCNLLALSDWLAEQEVTQAAMERPASTGSPSSTSWRAARRAAGQRPAHQAGAGPQDRRQGLRLDRQSAATRLAPCQLRAAAADPRMRDLTRQRASWAPRRPPQPTAFRRCWRTPTSSWLRLPRTCWGFPAGTCSQALIAGKDDPEALADNGAKAAAEQDSRPADRAARAGHGASPLSCCDCCWIT